MRNFIRNYLFKLLFLLAILETGFFMWNQNNRPEITADMYTVFSRQKIEMEPLTNDWDKDKDSIYIVGFTEPLHGKVFQKGRLLYYQSNINFHGRDSFTYVISDGRKKSKPGYIRLNVLENTAPISSNDVFVVFNGGANELQVLANDTDREKDSIYFDAVSTPLNGKIENINNKLFYTPKEHFTGRDSFNYVITDGSKKSGLAKVNLIVKSGEFGSDPYFGNALNYTFYNTRKYDVLTDGNNKVFAISNNLSLPWSGAIQEYCILKNRHYNNFNLCFKARPFVLEQWVEYAIIFSYKDNNNYCCIHFYYHDNTGRVQGFIIKDGVAKHIFLNDVKLFTDTKFHDVEVQKNADSVSVKFDKRYVGGTSDTRFLDKGAIGFGTRNRMIYFDDVYITEK